MFGSCSKLSSLDISSFNTNKCKSFSHIFENDEGLNLYYNSKTCSNLKDNIPSFVITHDVSENQ